MMPETTQGPREHRGTMQKPPKSGVKVYMFLLLALLCIVALPLSMGTDIPSECKNSNKSINDKLHRVCKYCYDIYRQYGLHTDIFVRCRANCYNNIDFIGCLESTCEWEHRTDFCVSVTQLHGQPFNASVLQHLMINNKMQTEDYTNSIDCPSLSSTVEEPYCHKVLASDTMTC